MFSPLTSSPLNPPTQKASPRLHKVVIWPLIASFLLLPVFAVQSQESIKDEDKLRIRIILLLINRQASIIEEELQGLSDMTETQSVLKKKDELQTQLDGFKNNFESLATQLSTDDLLLKEAPKKDWIKELQGLTMPLLDSISDLTEKPRKIEKLNKDIDVLKTQLIKYEGGTRNLTALLDIENSGLDIDAEDTQDLLENLKKLKNKYDPALVRIQLEETQRNLNNLLADQESILDTVTNAMRAFFKNRGLNLLIAFGSFVALWWILTRLRKYIVGKRSVVDLPPWLKKLMITVYNTFVVLICIVVSMVTLYLRNDWLLLSVIILFLAGIAWTSRQLIPRLFEEVRLGLNLGMVREGERMIWGGVPWLVTNIGLKVSLLNESLEGAEIKLPLRELTDKHSRPVVKDEPWFPTKVNDWVFLSDGTYGKIRRQTIEQVVVMLKGNSLKYYPTPDFLNLAPLNISGGFRYDIAFGLDHSAQPRICDEIPNLFKEGLRRRLQHRFQEESPDFLHIEVTFHSAGRNSLDLRIVLDADGRCAGLYDVIEREIHTALVSICNEHGLSIPFNKLSLNLSEDLKKSGAAQNLPPGTPDS